MYLGIEIGGTKLQLAVGDGQGSPFAAMERRQVEPREGAAGIRRQITEVAASLAKGHSLEQVGIGFGGPFDAATGRTIKSHQIDGWDDFPLIEWMRAQVGLPVVVGNDCDVAALAEARFGAGRGAKNMLYVTVGTGVGGGLVLNGKLHGQRRPAVAEVGHLRPGLDCTDPHDTVESYASGWGIERATRSAVQSARSDEPDAKDLLERCGGELARLTTRNVSEAAGNGNALARSALDQACRVLGWAIAQTITLTAVEKVVIGGGVSLIGEEHFFSPLRQQIARYAFPPLARSYEVVPAALGEWVVVHGALALAAESDTFEHH